MDEPARRAWSKPELIVLVRSGPEEAVLVTCKTNLNVTGYAFNDIYCNASPVDECVQCITGHPS